MAIVNKSRSSHGNPVLYTLPALEDDSVLRMQVKMDQLDGFIWDHAFAHVLSSISRTGLPSPNSPADWHTILKIVLFNLRLVVHNYLKLGPPALFDKITSKDDQTRGWLWKSEDVQTGVDRICLSLADFTEQRQLEPEPASENACLPDHIPSEHLAGIKSAPFTIQRLAELVSVPQSNLALSDDPHLGVHPHYNTLPKYLRAIQRVLSITSPVASFSIDTFSLPHPFDTHPAVGGLVQENLINWSHSLSNGRPASATFNETVRPRRPSTSTPVTPVLSPIGWLNVPPERSPSSSPTRHSRHTSPAIALPVNGERPITPPLGTPHLRLGSPALSLEPSIGLNPSSPSGRIDELDPGLGTAEELTDGPVAIGSTALGDRPDAALSPPAPSHNTEELAQDTLVGRSTGDVQADQDGMGSEVARVGDPGEAEENVVSSEVNGMNEESVDDNDVQMKE